MKTFKEIEQVWQSYCKESSIEVSETITVGYNPSEFDEHKVEILDNSGSITMSIEEAKMLGEKLVALTSDKV